VLSARALGRATLARQQLLERARRPVAGLVEHLLGMQAQIPANPYVALWSRLEDLDTDELSQLIGDCQAVRATAMRATLHLFTARDYAWVRPLMQPMLQQRFMTGSPFGKRLAGLDIDEVLRAGREALEGTALTTTQLAAILHERWPDRDANSLAYAVTYQSPLIQIPPRGMWRRSKQPTWALAESFAGISMATDASLDELVLRYLAAFGPATVMDIQAWCGLTKLRSVVDGLRGRLVTFRDPHRRELFDLPDAPRPDPETPAPVRFLPEYDNVLLGFADRGRFFPDTQHRPLDTEDAYWCPFLVGGAVAGKWRLLREGGSATLGIKPAVVLTPPQRVELEEEGHHLLDLIAAGAGSRGVRYISEG
jgi:winged helix DNA-binding protein